MRPGSSTFLTWVVGGAANAPWIGEARIAKATNAANTAAPRRVAAGIFGLVLPGSVTKTSVISVSPSSPGFPGHHGRDEEESEGPIFLRDVARFPKVFQLFRCVAQSQTGARL
jgi:hypothetical protein